LEEVKSWTAAGDRVALATVVETWGSSPRPLGSKMVVSSSGKMAGSVSNGCIEGDVFQEAQKVLAAGKGRLVPYGVADDVAFEVGLACGGHVEVMIQPITPEHLKLIELIEAERPAELRTNLETGEVQLLERAPELDAPARDGDWFVEPHRRAPQLVIIGAIHIAIPLHRMAKLLGYRVTVIDARAKFATKERFPEADELLVSWPDEALAGITLDRSTYVVILTHDPKFDLPALRSVVGKDVRYLGAIGSRKTNQNRFDELRRERFTEEQLEQVHGPIGLDLGGRGAEETALAILAEMTAVKYHASGRTLKEAKARV
jgi:xanthine dehydrogenase accessory factor